MGRMYTLTLEGQAITANMDIFSVLPATGHDIVLHSVEVTQSSDYGDAAAEGVRIAQIRGATTVGSGGSAYTPLPNNPGQAAAATARRLDTSQASAGTPVIMHAQAMNVQVGYFYRPTPEERFRVVAGTYWQLSLVASPADSLTVSVTVVFEELDN